MSFRTRTLHFPALPGVVAVAVLAMSVGCHSAGSLPLLSRHFASGQSRAEPSRPLEIPYPERRRGLEAGNLVANPSFELGRGGTPSEWETESGVGCRRIRAQDSARRHALVLEPIDGNTEEACLSSFIRVIPGHYRLTASFLLPSDNGSPPSPPLSVGAVEADGRRGPTAFLLYYDSRKHPLHLYGLTPLGRRIDIGMKTRAFSVPGGHGPTGSSASGRWVRVPLVSAYYPVDSEWLPPEVAFVRIGLLYGAAGRLLVDDVNLRYTKWNFTLKERLSPLLSNMPRGGSRILPRPRYAKQVGPPIDLFDPAGGPGSCLVLPEGSPPALRAAADHLLAAARRLSGTNRSLALASANQAPSGCRVVIYLGARSQLGQPGMSPSPAGPLLPNAALPDSALPDSALPDSEGYRIHFTEASGDSPPRIYAIGESPRGAYYAALSLAMLFIEEADMRFTKPLAIERVEVVDWPTYRGRAVGLYFLSDDEAEIMLRTALSLGRAKLNRVYVNRPSLTARWWNPPERYHRVLEKVGEHANRTGIMGLGVLIHPYAHRTSRSTDTPFENYGDPIFRRLLRERVAAAVEAGAETIYLCTDDLLPTASPGRRFRYTVSESDGAGGPEALAALHAELLKEALDVAAARGADTAIHFVPPWYNNMFFGVEEDWARRYFRVLHERVPPTIGLVWTGPVVRSLIVDPISTARFQDLVPGRPLIYWDNTLYARQHRDGWSSDPDRAPLASLLEPYEPDFPEAFTEPQASREIYINGHIGALYELRYLTVADYLWNPEEYDADRSLAAALLTRLGHDGARAILEWDNLYWKANAAVLVLRRQEKGTRFGLISRRDSGAEAARELLQAATELRRILGREEAFLLSDIDRATVDLLSKLEAARTNRHR